MDEYRATDGLLKQEHKEEALTEQDSLDDKVAPTHQKAQMPEPFPAKQCEQSGIRRDPETGKLHIFGNPDPRWLEEQGWEWSEKQARFVAPYPHDRIDPHPRFFVSAKPAKTDNRMTGSGPCSICDFTLWWRRAGDITEGWTCSVCHPAPEGMEIITPQTI